MSESEAGGKLQPDNVRSPCSDAHYEAFIIQSKWTVDNLYASNVNLGQDYVKRVKLMEKQRKTWLLGKCREQQKFEKRMRELENVQRLASASGGEFRRRQQGFPSVKPTSRHESLERLSGSTLPLSKTSPNARSISQPCPPPGFFVNSPANKMEQQKQNYTATAKQICPPRPCRPRLNTLPVQSQMTSRKVSPVYSETDLPLTRKSFSVSTPLLNYKDSSPEDRAVINTELIPKYIPSKLRSRNSTLF